MADAIVLKSVIHDWDDQPVSNPAKLLPRYSKTWDAAFHRADYARPHV